jgi:hypothetical protein
LLSGVLVSGLEKAMKGDGERARRHLHLADIQRRRKLTLISTSPIGAEPDDPTRRRDR